MLIASQISASEITVSSRSDFENLVINKKLERFLISLSVTKDGKIIAGGDYFDASGLTNFLMESAASEAE